MQPGSYSIADDDCEDDGDFERFGQALFVLAPVPSDEAGLDESHRTVT